MASRSTVEAKRRRLAAGSTVRARVSTTDGRVVLADLVAERVDTLGCGCRRVTALRPGPQPDEYQRLVQALTGCLAHPAEMELPGDATPM
jgi:hypothetical protein